MKYNKIKIFMLTLLMTTALAGCGKNNKATDIPENG